MTEFSDKAVKQRLTKHKKAEIANRHREIMTVLKSLLEKDPKVSIGKVTAESDKEAIKSISEAVKLLLTVNEQTKTLGGQFGGISSLLERLTKRLEQVPSEFTLSDTRPDRTDEILAVLRELGNLNIEFPKFPDIPETDTQSIVDAVKQVKEVLQDILERPQAVGLGGGGGGESSGGGTATLGEQESQTALLTTIDADTGAIATDVAAIEVLLTTIEGNQLPDGHNVTVDNASLAVTAASLPLPAGASTSANQSTLIGHVDGIEGLLTTIDADTSNLSIVGGGTEATAIRVTIANDSTGVLSVDDNGSSLTVDGTVTANLSATDNAVLDTIDAVLDTIKVDTEAIETAVEAIQAGQLANGHNVVVTSAPTTAVTGTFWQATQPVSGTVTANLGATDNGVLDSIDEAVSSKQITGIGDGVTTVTTAGTDVALAGSTACKKVTVQAQTDNTGLIAVGATGVDATEATGTGIILRAGDSFEFDIDNLADISIDATVNGEGVRYVYFT